MDVALPRDRRAFLVALAADEGDLEGRDGRERVLRGADVVRPVAGRAARGERVARASGPCRAATSRAASPPSSWHAPQSTFLSGASWGSSLPSRSAWQLTHARLAWIEAAKPFSETKSDTVRPLRSRREILLAVAGQAVRVLLRVRRPVAGQASRTRRESRLRSTSRAAADEPLLLSRRHRRVSHGTGRLASRPATINRPFGSFGRLGRTVGLSVAREARRRPLDAREPQRRPRVVEAQDGDDAPLERRRQADEAASHLPAAARARTGAARRSTSPRAPGARAATARPAARERHDQPVARGHRGQALADELEPRAGPAHVADGGREPAERAAASARSAERHARLAAGLAGPRGAARRAPRAAAAVGLRRRSRSAGVIAIRPARGRQPVTVPWTSIGARARGWSSPGRGACPREARCPPSAASAPG